MMESAEKKRSFEIFFARYGPLRAADAGHPSRQVARKRGGH